MSLENTTVTATDEVDQKPAKETEASQQVPKLDPEYAQWVAATFPPDVTPPPMGSIPEMRPAMETMVRGIFARFPPQPNITQTSYTIQSYDGASIQVIHFAPPTTSPPPQHPQPAVLHFHGGGHCANSVDIFTASISELVATSGVHFFSVEYRLAPEHPFPAAIEDGYAALTWLSSQAASLGIDASRIGIMGESSGGGLAAGIALLARDRGVKPALKQSILIYPMLDDRSITQNPGWDPESRSIKFLTLCWEAYLGADKAGRPDADVSPYAAPARAENLKGLPKTYIEVGDLDEFLNECVGFAERLRGEGVEVEERVWPGVPHGFDGAREIGVTRRAIEGRVRVLKGI